MTARRTGARLSTPKQLQHAAAAAVSGLQGPAAKAKPKHYTGAQNKAFRVYTRRHPYSRAQNMAYRKAQRVHARRAAIGDVLESGYWLTGSNDEMPSCVATAVGNSLLAATGIRVGDDDVLALFLMAGEGPVSIAHTLATLSREGISRVRPISAVLMDEGAGLMPGDILGLTDGVNDHAATWTTQGLISWGAPLDLDLADGWFLDGEHWRISWRGEGN